MITSRYSLLTLMSTFRLPGNIPLLTTSKAIDSRNPGLLATVEGTDRDTSLNVTTLGSRAGGERITCETNVTADSYEYEFYNRYPWDLAFVQWTGGGEVSCSTTMSSISFNLWAINRFGKQHVIATSECPECTELTATNTQWKCQQGPEDCDGAWKVKWEVKFEGPPSSVFEPQAGCVTEGGAATCAGTGNDGTVPSMKYNLVLPDGFDKVPQLDAEAITHIRERHFADGSALVRDEGVFDSSKTDTDLQRIFEQGMESSEPWGPADKPNYRRKHWGLAGQGSKSPNGPAFSSDGMDLIINNEGRVITMYPT